MPKPCNCVQCCMTIEAIAKVSPLVDSVINRTEDIEPESMFMVNVCMASAYALERRMPVEFVIDIVKDVYEKLSVILTEQEKRMENVKQERV